MKDGTYVAWADDRSIPVAHEDIVTIFETV